MFLLRTLLVVTMMLVIAETMPPLAYQKIENADLNQQKYEYQYDVKSDRGVGQGKTEIGDGVLASGRYYVDGKNSSQNVEYVADDWGYHPYVEFQNTGPFSQSSAQMALDKEAVKMMNKKNQDQVNDAAAASPKPIYIPLQINQDDNNDEKSVPEYVQEYLPAVSEPNTLPQAEYLFLEQNPKYIYVQNTEQDTKNAVFLQPLQYDQYLGQQPQNFETIPLSENPARNVLQPEKPSYYESIFQQPLAYGTKIHSQNRVRPQNMRVLSHITDLINDQDVLDINTTLDKENQEHSVSPVLNNTEKQVVASEPATEHDHNQSFLEQPIYVSDAENSSEDQATIVVTPRPVSNALLAPLTATVKLRSIAKIEDSKPVHQNYVVDVQKSIPFYLGKIEYYDNIQNKEKNVTATATQHIRLGGLLQQPIIEKTKIVANNQAPLANFSQSFDKSSDNSKYVAEETKIVENPLLTLPHSASKNVESFKSFDRHIAIPLVINKSVVSQPSPQAAQVMEKKSPVPEYVETPVPVEKSALDSGSYFGHGPYPVAVQVPIASEFYLPLEIPKLYPVQLTKLVIPTAYSHQEPAKFQPTYKNAKRLKNQDHDHFIYTNNLQSYNKAPCIDLRLFGVRKPYCPKINNNHYIGLVPPKVQAPVRYNATNNVVRKQRTAREGVLDNIRWEYGFMPPLIPSLAIDENGNPVDKHSK